TVDFILFPLLFCSAFLYLDLHIQAKFKIKESRKKQKEIEGKIEDFPHARAGPHPPPRRAMPSPFPSEP
ncbi:hypothetical protein, partial [Rugamonas sp.]|uniref:hypothetical protein n=1 Tax=Rugamonas sp. TaxID=1926287 RepID=UPI0025F9DC0E